MLSTSEPVFQPTTTSIPVFPKSCTENDNFGRGRIVGGISAGPLTWPWLVAFSFYKGRIEQDRCGGTIISNHAILTGMTKKHIWVLIFGGGLCII